MNIPKAFNFPNGTLGINIEENKITKLATNKSVTLSITTNTVEI
jgi:hypothetical protein